MVLLLEERDNLFFLLTGGHTEGEVNLALEVVAEVGQHGLVEVAGRWNLDEFRFQGTDLLGRGDIPDGSRVLNAILGALYSSGVSNSRLQRFWNLTTSALQ